MSFIDIVLIEDLTPDPSPVRRGEKGFTNFTIYIEFNELVKKLLKKFVLIRGKFVKFVDNHCREINYPC